MPHYDPDAEGDGQYVIAFLDSADKVSPIFKQKVQDIFEEHFGTLDSDAWYRVEDIANAYEAVLEETGEKTMEQGGIETGKSVSWPDEVESLQDALDTCNDIHEAAYRNSDEKFPAGKYTVDHLVDTVSRVGITKGYALTTPCAKGIFKGYAKDLTSEAAFIDMEAVDTQSNELAAWRLEW